MIEVPMTDEQFAANKERLRGHGLELDGASGTVRKDGITATYEHANGMLRIEIVDKPMLFPMSMIEARLKSYLDQA